MARKDEQKANTNGHDSGGIKVRVIEFELHGRNATVSEGIKAITEAITGRGVVVAEPSRPALPAVPKKETATPTLEVEEPDQETVEPETAEPEADEIVETSASNGSGGPKRKYSFKTPKFLNDLDISKASKPLAEFVKEKNPTDLIDKYIMVVVWLYKHLSVPEVTIDHVYTIFDQLGWKGEMPANPSIPLRDLKSKKYMLTREEGAEGYKPNFKGEQYVEKMGK